MQFPCCAASPWKSCPERQLRDAVSRVQIRAFRAKTSQNETLTRKPAPLGKRSTGRLGSGIRRALYREEPIPAANAFGGGRSGFGPWFTDQRRTRVTARGFPSQVKHPRTQASPARRTRSSRSRLWASSVRILS